MTKLACISDLHQVDRGPRDSFDRDGRESRLWKFGDWADKQGAQVVMLGDVADFYQTSPMRWAEAYHGWLVHAMERGWRWIPGNHDSLLPWLNTEKLFVPNFWRRHAKAQALLCHGHEWDSTCNTPNPGLGELTAVLTGLLEDRRGSAVRPDGRYVEDVALSWMFRIWRWFKFGRINAGEFYEKAKHDLTLMALPSLVCGHTHEAGQIGTWYFNTGCWCRDLDTFALVHEDGKVELMEWTRDCTAKPFVRELKWP